MGEIGTIWRSKYAFSSRFKNTLLVVGRWCGHEMTCHSQIVFYCMRCVFAYGLYVLNTTHTTPNSNSCDISNIISYSRGVCLCLFIYVSLSVYVRQLFDRPIVFSMPFGVAGPTGSRTHGSSVFSRNVCKQTHTRIMNIVFRWRGWNVLFCVYVFNFLVSLGMDWQARRHQPCIE